MSQPQPEQLVREAVEAVDRARTALRSTSDPLLAAVDSALSCAVALVALRQRQADLDPLRDALGAARALVAEVAFAVHERHGATTS